MGGTAASRSALSRVARLVLVAVGVGFALLATPLPASAHPVLLFTDPALDGAVTDPPPSVTLVFNEGVTAGRGGDHRHRSAGS